jgi:hypothetical protein
MQKVASIVGNFAFGCTAKDMSNFLLLEKQFSHPSIVTQSKLQKV